MRKTLRNLAILIGGSLFACCVVTILVALFYDPEPTPEEQTATFERAVEIEVEAFRRLTATVETWTPTPTSTATDTPTATATPTITPTPTRTPIPSRTPLPSITPRPSNTPPPTIRPQTRYVNTASVNVRECAGTACGIVGVLDYGDSFEAIARDTDSDGNTWYGFDAYGSIRWIAGWLTVTTRPPTPAPAIQQPPAAAPPAQQQPPAQQPPPAPAWSCGGDIYNCDSFGSCAEMWSYWNSCPGDPSRLDRDNDGYPCESQCG